MNINETQERKFMNPTKRDTRSSWQPRRAPTRTATLAGAAICLAGLMVSSTAFAQSFRLNVEPAVAIMMDESQSSRFTPGFYGAIRPGVALGRVVTLRWSYAALLMPAAEGFTEFGTAHFLMTGVRVRPLALITPKKDQLGGMVADVNLGYVRTGGLDRFGLDVGLGYGFQLSPTFSLGPVLRYNQVLQADSTLNVLPEDAQFITAGPNLSFGAADKEPVKVADCPECMTCPECVQRAEVVRVVEACPDRDRDGVCDADDLCPKQIGPPATFGCPIDPCGTTPLRVLVQFDLDSAQLPAIKPTEEQTMDPILDAVGLAISKDAACRVCIVGYASEDGPPEHNQALSMRRSSAVQKNLSASGLATKRTPTTGMGEHCQLIPEASRVLNRRVEFHRLETGESCPTDCSK